MVNVLKKIFVIKYLLLMLMAYGQSDNKYFHNAMAEKIYLQLNNDIHFNTDTVWFKAILANAATHKLERTSAVLYVDLINKNNKVLVSKLVKINDGIGHGQIDLNKEFLPGNYLLRAYTEWNKNFENDFIFEKYITLVSTSDSNLFQKPIKNLSRIESEQGTKLIKADIFPKVIDSNHQGKLKCIISKKHTKDTIQIRGKDNYLLEYVVDNPKDVVKLTFITSNGNSYSQKINAETNFIDLQFFPESGKLINGFKSKVGFKAVGPDGTGKMVSGNIFDANGKLVTVFKSNPLGMGSFLIDKPVFKMNYYAEIQSENNIDSKIIALPEVYINGSTLSVGKTKDSIQLNIKSNIAQKYFLEGICRGYTYYQKEIILNNAKANISISNAKFPEGVIAFKLSDTNGNPIAERLFFNLRKDRRINLSANLENETQVKQRQKMELNINTSDSKNNPLESNISILILNNNELGELKNTRDNILSHFLLDSELKGKIETPGVYFRNNSYDIDHLMLTQGWRNFLYKKSVGYASKSMEKNLYVNGIININGAKKNKDSVEIMLMAFDKEKTVYTTKAKAPGSFKFNLLDIYGGTSHIALQTLGTSKKELKKVKIAIDEKAAIPANFNYPESFLSFKKSTLSPIISKRIEERKRYNNIFDINGVTVLDEVVLNGYIMTPKRKEIYEKHGKPSVVIEGKEIKEKEQKWSFGLVSVLESFFRDKIIIRRDLNGIPKLTSVKENSKQSPPTLVIVDGIPVRDFEYENLQNIKVDQVTSFEVIDNADRFGSLFTRVYPRARPPIPTRGSIVAIYTKAGVGIYGAINFDRSDVLIKEISVFSLEREYYTPKYTDEDSNKPIIPDLRSPVVWKPQIKIDNKGKVKFDFYHSDNVGDFTIIIEAFSSTGQLGYGELQYSVFE